MARRTDSVQGSLELLILKTLDSGANHGFGIALHVQTVSDGALRLEEGSLYPALHRLRKQGLLRSSWKVTDNGRRAKYYSLTRAGQRRLQEAQTSWLAVAQGVEKVLRFA